MNTESHSRWRRTLCSPLVASLLVAASGAAAAAPHPFTFEDMLKLARVSDAQLSPDGQTLYFAQAPARLEHNRWQSALYMLPLGASAPQRLTWPERGPKREGQDIGPRLSPDGRYLAFISTRDGEPGQLYLLGTRGGEARRLTDLPGGASDPLWSPDGKALIVAARVYADCPPYPAGEECNKSRHEAQQKNPVKARVIERLYYRHWDDWYDGRRSHLLRVPLPEPAAVSIAPPVDLTPGEFDTPPLGRAGVHPYALSPDGKELAYVQNRDKDAALSTNHDIWVLALGKEGVAASRPRSLTSKNLATDAVPRYSPDGRYLAYLAQRRPGFEADRMEVWLYDRQSGQHRSLTAAFDASAGELVWSPDSRRLYFTISLKGRGAIYAVEVSGQGAPFEISVGDAHGLQVVASGDGAQLVFLRSSFSRPSEVYRVPLDDSGHPAGTATPLTHVNDAVLADTRRGQSSQLWAKSQDGLQLHSHLVTPPDFSPTRRYPAVVLLHGGPQGAWEDLWQWRWCAQIYAGAGYVVLLPNPRGSEGFGQRFVDEVSGDWGGKVYDDIMRSVDVLVAQPYVDGHRVAALGASYGGFLVDWIAGHTDRFAALVSHAGVYDPRSMHGETEEIWFPRWEFGGDPWASEQYDKWSPSRFAARFKTPTLVISGEHDYRVPVGQSMQFFTALQLRKVPSKLVIFPDENHWVAKPLNARLWYATVLDWLHRYLGGAPSDAKLLEQVGSYAR